MIDIPWAAMTLAAPAANALPDGVKAMIDAAIAEGKPQELATIIRLARIAHPGAASRIDEIEATIREEREASGKGAPKKRRTELARAKASRDWNGQVEFGASRSTGNSRNLGLFGALQAEREGFAWRHKLAARAEIQENNNVRTTERALLSWQPSYKFHERLYGFGLAQYEYDPLLGYDNRYTASGGIGYGAIASDRVKLDLEGGPAFRFTDRITGEQDAKVAGRASLNFSWKVTPTLELKQSGAVYVEGGDSSASALTVLDTKLIGALKGRFSYNVQYEHDAPLGAKPLDTVSRATLVYGF